MYAKSGDSESLKKGSYCHSGLETVFMLQRTFEPILTCQVFHLFGEYLAVSLSARKIQDCRVYSTAKHSGVADVDGDLGSQTELTREGPPGGPKGLGPYATPTRKAQM